MKLLIERLGDSPVPYRLEADPAWGDTALQTVPELAGGLAEAPVVELSAHRMGETLYLEGVVEGALELGCARCLARYRQPLREPFRLVLEPVGTRMPSEPEAVRSLASHGMCVGDELELGWYRGAEIDLGGFVLEVIALAVPVQPLCREECQGLCPRCGVDRNRESCDCADERTASPFAALQALRDRASEGES